IILESVAEKPSENHFALIIRHHPHNLDSLISYFEQEENSYQGLEIQGAKDLIYLGNGASQTGCCTLFLTSSTLTLDVAFQKGLIAKQEIKLELAKSLLAQIQQAHENEIFGFDLRPSQILYSYGERDLSTSIIGYVGDSSVTSKHPDCTKLKWDAEWAAPEVVKKSRQQRSRPVKVSPLSG
ncbi:MAG: hypothetical protein EZS28_047136, partial [Streblomastix strix]